MDSQSLYLTEAISKQIAACASEVSLYSFPWLNFQLASSFLQELWCDAASPLKEHVKMGIDNARALPWRLVSATRPPLRCMLRRGA